MNALAASSITSPRARGEVARRSPTGEGGRVRGAVRESELLETPPHPDPLPARGEREKGVRIVR